MVYRTGDLVKKQRDGNYVFVRRMDDQVKVNGYRIELGEVEMVLTSYHQVDQVVVLLLDGRLVAYVRPKPGVMFDAGEVEYMKSFASKSLTSYMMPKDVVVVDTFPLTPTMKIDRKAIPLIYPAPTLGSSNSNIDDAANEVTNPFYKSVLFCLLFMKF
jgi:acyl-coenzyme A synthetase/AMP-(fatty) acid ligase